MIDSLLRYVKSKFYLWRSKRHWNEYYKSHRENMEPSSFAVFCFENYIKHDGKLLELGCGNGRDAFYFASHNLVVDAIDLEEEEIQYLQAKNQIDGLNFIAGDFSKFSSVETYDYIYSRFTLHSVNLKTEKRTLAESYRNLKDNGLFFIEARSIKDDMLKQSKKISLHEGLTDHYRRFLDFAEFKRRLGAAGFELLHAEEAQGLAVKGDENPWVIRIVARKISGIN